MFAYSLVKQAILLIDGYSGKIIELLFFFVACANYF